MDRRFSEQEARQIFALAAEREHAVQAHPAAGLTLSDLEEAARAAGMDPAFVQAAAADFLHAGDKPMRRTFAGMPVGLRRTRVLKHTLDDEGWAEVVAACRRIFGKHGLVTDLGRSREWVSEASDRRMPVRVLVEETDGSLRVTIDRSMWQRVLGLSVSSGVNFTVGLALFFAWLATTPSPLWIPALVLVSFALLFGAGTYTSLRLSERRDVRRFADTFAVIEQIAASRAEDAATPQAQDALDLPAARLALEDERPAPDVAARSAAPTRTRS